MRGSHDNQGVGVSLRDRGRRDGDKDVEGATLVLYHPLSNALHAPLRLALTLGGKSESGISLEITFEACSGHDVLLTQNPSWKANKHHLSNF